MFKYVLTLTLRNYSIPQKLTESQALRCLADYNDDNTYTAVNPGA